MQATREVVPRLAFLSGRKKLAKVRLICWNTTVVRERFARSTLQGGTRMSRIVTPPTVKPANTPPLTVSQEKIAIRAYEKWLKRGQPQGTEMQDWLEAENELKAEMQRAKPSSRP
jgi:hypothetical protein